jgi:hypothetical protein
MAFMKRNSIVGFCFLFCLPVCTAQPRERIKNNALSLELGKTGLIYNLGFDHRFQDKNFGIRIGIGSNFAKYLSAFSTGGGAYYLTGKNNNHLELGIDISYLIVDEVSDDQKGFTLIYPDYSIKTYYTSLNIGYRKYGKRSLFRVGVSPGFIKDGFVQGGYISYGLRF